MLVNAWLSSSSAYCIGTSHNITLTSHVVVQGLNYATASPSSYVQAQIFPPSLHVKSTCFFGMPCIKKTFILPYTSKSSLSVPSGIA